MIKLLAALYILLPSCSNCCIIYSFLNQASVSLWILYYRGRQDQFFTALPEMSLRYRNKLQKTLLHHFTTTPFIFLGCSSQFGGGWGFFWPVLEFTPETEPDQVFCLFRLAKRAQHISQRPQDLSIIIRLWTAEKVLWCRLTHAAHRYPWPGNEHHFLQPRG